MKSAWRIWRDYWFRPAPVFNLGVARIMTVTYQLVALAWWSPPIAQFPRLLRLEAIHEPLALWRLLFRPISPEWFPPLGFLEGVYWATVVLGVLALIGLATHVSLSLFTLGWVILLSHAFSFNEFHHQEALIIFMLTFLALSPSGRALSVDRALSTGRRSAGRPSTDILAETSTAARWPFLAIMVMLSLIYGSAVYAKVVNGGVDWLNGYSLRYSLLQDGLWRNIPLSVGPLQQQHWFVVLLSYGSVFYEGGFFLALLFPALLPALVLAGIAGHVGIWFLMRADFSEYVVVLLTLLPWAAIAARLRKRKRARQGSNLRQPA